MPMLVLLLNFHLMFELVQENGWKIHSFLKKTLLRSWKSTIISFVATVQKFFLLVVQIIWFISWRDIRVFIQGILTIWINSSVKNFSQQVKKNFQKHLKKMTKGFKSRFLTKKLAKLWKNLKKESVRKSTMSKIWFQVWRKILTVLIQETPIILIIYNFKKRNSEGWRSKEKEAFKKRKMRKNKQEKARNL